MCQLFLSVYVDAIKMAGRQGPATRTNWRERATWLDSTLINQVYLGCTQREAVTMDEIVSAQSDLFALLTSSDTDVFSRRESSQKTKDCILEF